MMVFWVDSASHAVTSIDAYSTGHATPSPDTTLGGTSDLTGVSGSLVRCGLAGWLGCLWLVSRCSDGRWWLALFLLTME